MANTSTTKQRGRSSSRPRGGGTTSTSTSTSTSNKTTPSKSPAPGPAAKQGSTGAGTGQEGVGHYPYPYPYPGRQGDPNLTNNQHFVWPYPPPPMYPYGPQMQGQAQPPSQMMQPPPMMMPAYPPPQPTSPPKKYAQAAKHATKNQNPKGPNFKIPGKQNKSTYKKSQPKPLQLQKLQSGRPNKASASSVPSSPGSTASEKDRKRKLSGESRGDYNDGKNQRARSASVTEEGRRREEYRAAQAAQNKKNVTSQTLQNSPFIPIAAYIEPEDDFPLEEVQQIDYLEAPKFAKEPSTDEMKEMRQFIGKMYGKQEELIRQQNRQREAAEAKAREFNSYKEAIETRTKEMADDLKQLAIKVAEVQTQYAKQCISLTGDAIPAPTRNEDVAKIAAGLIRDKWGIRVGLADIANVHRTSGGRAIVLRLFDQKPGSLHDRICRRYEVGWEGTTPEARAIKLDAKQKMADLENESQGLLLFIKEQDRPKPWAEKRVGKINTTPGGALRFKTGIDMVKERADKKYHAKYRYVRHPDELLDLFDSDEELRAYQERVPPEHFSGITRVKRRTGKTAVQKRIEKAQEAMYAEAAASGSSSTEAAVTGAAEKGEEDEKMEGDEDWKSTKEVASPVPLSQEELELLRSPTGSTTNAATKMDTTECAPSPHTSKLNDTIKRLEHQKI